MSGIVTALVAIIAVLGTMVFFLYQGSNPLYPSDNNYIPVQPPQAQQTSSVEQTGDSLPPEDVAEAPTPVPEPSHTTSSMTTQEQECGRLGIEPNNCTENAILAAQRFAASQGGGSVGIQISNSHIWVAPNGTSSVAGLVVQNTGDDLVSIDRITIRGQSVPQTSWYYNTADATAVNIQRQIAPDFNLASIDVTGDGTEESFTQASGGTVSLMQGQAIFVYLNNPAGIAAIDSGLAFTMNVQAGKASAVQSVSVVNG